MPRTIFMLNFTATQVFRLFCILSVNAALSQSANIKFKHLSIREGLSQSTVNTILQDEMGFMWFGTQDGLNKYDGYDFITYKHEIDDSGTVSGGFINCLQNDNNGHLWIGTNTGISIFHQRSCSFLQISEDYPELKILAKSDIKKITIGPDSSVWIATGNDVYRLTAGKQLQHLPLRSNINDAPADIEITDVEIAGDDEVWISSRVYGIFIYNVKSGTMSSLKAGPPGTSDRLNSSKINVLYRCRNGQIYIGSDFGLNIYDPLKKSISSYVYHTGKPFAISSNFITDIYEDHLGHVWLGTNGGGLNKFIPARQAFYAYKKSVSNESTIISNDITSIYQDNSGVMWIGTSLGLSKFDLLKQNFNHFQFDQASLSGISRNIIWSVLSEGDMLWVGSNEGLNVFNRNQNSNESFVPTFVVNNEHRANAIYALMRKNAGALYVGTDGGVYEFNTSYENFRPAVIMGRHPSERTYTIMRDSREILWIASRDGLHMFDERNGVYRHFNTEKGLPNNIVRKVLESSDGTIWIGTDNGLCRLHVKNGRYSFEVFKNEKGKSNSLRNNTILTLAEDEGGFIWAGTFGGGLNRLDPRTGNVLSYTEKDGLPNNVIYGILIDEKNNLWCSTNKGLTRFSAASKSVRNFDEFDGLQSNEFNVGAYCSDESGELFFGGIKGVNSFFASQIQINNLPPRLVITDFQLFNLSVKAGQEGILTESVSVTDEIVLSYSQNIISFSFSALHYSLPERNRYAYKLEGFDDNWTFDDNTRRAKYTNLDPGKYVFKVKGTNSDGIWSKETSLRIIIKPPFWSIWWIQVLAALALLGGAFYFYRTRMKVIQAQKDRLEKEVEMRTIEVRDQKEEIEKQKLLLEEEKEKLETLLLNVLPESTVEELKMKGKATARNYNKVTVMFTDFKGFTKIAESLAPAELVSKLDSFFIKFDEVIEKHNIEKIKTIGDAYMCAGGIPIRNKSNPIDVVLAGLEIQRVMREFNLTLKDKGEDPWGLRLGIHTGIIIAGVIGIKRFAYDIWGDTVNVASRIETNGEVGMVNVSEVTYEEVKDFFECEYRGKINAKNKGEIDMYYIHRIKPYLSVDGKGTEPNDTFWEYVNLALFSPVEYHRAEDNIIEKLETMLPKSLHYHSVGHTKDVCSAVERIALQEGIFNEDIYALKMAALYHDAGFIEKYQNNEAIGAKMAREDLPAFGFSDEQVRLIEKLILGTFTNKLPETTLEKILRDADLDYLGREDFHQVSEKLMRELLDRGMVRSEEHWDQLQVSFLEKHEYYTESARKERNELKAKHLEEIRARVAQARKNKVTH